MKVTKTNAAASGIDQAEAQQAFEDALTTVNPDDTVATRHHDCSIDNIEDNAGSLVEVRIDNDTAGDVLGAAVKSVYLSCTFGEPVEICFGANAGAAVRKIVANLGEGPLEIPLKALSTDRVYVRSLSGNGVTSGVLTINFMG